MATETASDLTGGAYCVCEQCKEGKYYEDVNFDPSPDLKGWVEHHSLHGMVNLQIATNFLSMDLPNGYIDVDRPDLEPLILKIPGDNHEEKGGLQPTGVAGAADIQRQMRNARGGGDTRRPTLEARQPTLQDMQLTLPWTVKYSRDYRSNPESHKDFRHAITHVMKATGKLCIIIDDYDHRRASEFDAKAKDYLADLVICAMRAANVYPGGVINLMQAVQDRVTDKNFTNVKKVIEDEGPE